MNRQAAARVVRRLQAAPGLRLQANPKLGRRRLEFAPRQVRRVFVDDDELRYELAEKIIVVINIWHIREDRGSVVRSTRARLF